MASAADDPRANVFPHGLEDEVALARAHGLDFGPPTVVITHLGLRVVVRFAPGDYAGRGPVQEVRILPGEQELEPSAVRALFPRFEIYSAHARAAMRILGDPEAPPTERWDAFRDSVAPLREIGKPGRGLPDEHYRRIAAHYNALVAEGERHPVKTLGEQQHTDISNASRWVKEARRRGYIKEADNG